MRAVSTPSGPVRRPAQAPGQQSWGTRLLRGRPRDPAWARPALLGLLVATAVLYLAGLSRSGYANEFYAAAVQAGTKSWKAFLFGSLDSSNFITVDKTPASLWVMELSGRAFGFSSWSLLAPQALEGVAAVGVLYATVRRWSGPAAATIAGAVLALTPVAALMFRFDNPDALLVLVMTLAAYTITRAVESGLTRWVALTGALLGLGYLTKMLQAFLVLPAFALVYLWAGQPSLGKRLWQLLAGLAALVAAAGWWVAIDLLTPAASRPYVGGSTDNNILQLTFGYNGLGRITGSESSAGGAGGSGTAARLGAGAARLGEAAAGASEGAARAGGAPSGGGGSMFGGATGIGRLFASDMGSQISWLLPAALIALAALLWLSRRSPRTDRTRAAALLWGGWLVVTGRGVQLHVRHHPPVLHGGPGAGHRRPGRHRRRRALADPAHLGRPGHPGRHAAGHRGLGLGAAGPEPRLAAVAPGGHRDRRGRRGRDDPGRAGPAGRQFPAAHPDGRRAAGPGPGGRAGRPAGLQRRHRGDGPHRVDPDRRSRRGQLLRRSRRRPAGRGWVPGRVGQLAGGRVCPGPDGLSRRDGRDRGRRSPPDRDRRGNRRHRDGGRTRDHRRKCGQRQHPDERAGAGSAGGPGGTGSVGSALSSLLESGASGYRWAAAAVGSQSAASLELGSNGVPVMAIGGFTGSDPAPTLAQFEKLVSAHEIHYFVASGSGGPGGGGGGSGYGSQITAWVKAHFTAKTVGGMTVYDLTAPKTGS